MGPLLSGGFNLAFSRVLVAQGHRQKKKEWLRHGPWLNSLLSDLAVVYFPLQKRNNRNKNND